MLALHAFYTSTLYCWLVYSTFLLIDQDYRGYKMVLETRISTYEQGLWSTRNGLSACIELDKDLADALYLLALFNLA